MKVQEETIGVEKNTFFKMVKLFGSILYDHEILVDFHFFIKKN